MKSAEQSSQRHLVGWGRALWLFAVINNAGQPFIIGAKSMLEWPLYVWLASTGFVLAGTAVRLSATRLFPAHAALLRLALAPTALGLKLVASVFGAILLVMLVGLAAQRNLF
jgi:hypothetical protein